MLIGVPTEIKNNEYRVGLTPDSVSSIVNSGHTVFIQKGAGLGIGFTDENYTNSGALIINSAKEVYQKSELIIKVKEPVESEYECDLPFSNCFPSALMLVTLNVMSIS